MDKRMRSATGLIIAIAMLLANSAGAGYFGMPAQEEPLSIQLLDEHDLDDYVADSRDRDEFVVESDKPGNRVVDSKNPDDLEAEPGNPDTLVVEAKGSEKAAAPRRQNDETRFPGDSSPK